VTENPSVVSAAADLTTNTEAIRLLCTNGTPSDVEIDAIARLAHRGWQIAVRADFDTAGLAHVAATLKAVPHALPWRMGTRDYLESLQCAMEDKVLFEPVPEAAWDPQLSTTIREHRIAAYEELLLPALLSDLQRGSPALLR
jgi:uncharacterized protein (TIGR02679 family)